MGVRQSETQLERWFVQGSDSQTYPVSICYVLVFASTSRLRLLERGTHIVGLAQSKIVEHVIRDSVGNVVSIDV